MLLLQAPPTPGPGSPSASAASSRPALRPSSARAARVALRRRPRRRRRARRRRSTHRPLTDAPQLELQPPLQLRPVHHRRRQPPRPRGRAGRRRAARPGLQPAVPARSARPRQDASAARDRQLRLALRRRDDRPLHDGRGVHQPLHHRARLAVVGPLQARLPRRRRAADRRRPVPRQQGKDRGGVLPHLQRAIRDRPAARAHLRPPAAPARRTSRSACGSASSPASSPTSAPPDFATRVAILRKRAALDDIELADDAVLELIAERVTDNVRALEGALIRIVALPLADRPADRPRARDEGPRRIHPSSRAGDG